MPRARYFYKPDEWIRVLDNAGWSYAEASEICGVDAATLRNIVGGQTAKARHDTRRKIIAGLSKAGINNEDIASLFRIE